MTDKNVNTEIRKEFCPNCEADVPCTHEAELFVCDICGEDFAKYIVSRNCNVSDVSMTRDVLTDIKTPRSIENNNPDYYKDELYLDEDFRMLSKTYPADVSAIGVTTLIDYVEALEAELARRDEELALTEKKLCNIDRSARAEVARRDEIIARLKEDAERLADGMIISPENEGDFCSYCGGMEHVDDCPITLHRALMKELE